MLLICNVIKGAGVAELEDAVDSKSTGPRDRGGSTPPSGTIIYFGG